MTTDESYLFSQGQMDFKYFFKYKFVDLEGNTQSLKHKLEHLWPNVTVKCFKLPASQLPFIASGNWISVFFKMWTINAI